MLPMPSFFLRCVRLLQLPHRRVLAVGGALILGVLAGTAVLM